MVANLENIQAIFIGGPGATKDYVVRNEYFHHEIAKKIAKKHFDVGYSNEVGIRDLVSEAGDLMANIMLDEERKVMNQFLSELIKSQPKATYGDAMVRKALADGAVDTLLISENKIDHEGRYRCETCYESWNHDIHKSEQSRTCPGCKSDHTFHKIWTSHDEFSELASKSNSKVAYISNDTEEGTQLLLGFGGLAAILRYPI